MDLLTETKELVWDIGVWLDGIPPVNPTAEREAEDRTHSLLREDPNRAAELMLDAARADLPIQEAFVERFGERIERIVSGFAVENIDFSPWPQVELKHLVFFALSGSPEQTMRHLRILAMRL